MHVSLSHFLSHDVGFYLICGSYCESSSVEAAFHGPVWTLSFSFPHNGSLGSAGAVFYLQTSTSLFPFYFYQIFGLKLCATYSVSMRPPHGVGSPLGQVWVLSLTGALCPFKRAGPCCQFIPSPVVGVGLESGPDMKPRDFCPKWTFPFLSELTCIFYKSFCCPMHILQCVWLGRECLLLVWKPCLHSSFLYGCITISPMPAGNFFFLGP